MAADNEVRLISKAIRDRNINPLLEIGVQADWFVNTDCRDVWRFIVSHWSKYGEVPTAVSVKDEYQNFPLLKVEDSLDYLLDRFVAYRRYVKVEDTVQGAAEVLSTTNDHEAALLLIESKIAEIHREGVPGITDMHLDRDPNARFLAYEALKNAVGHLLGLPTGYEKIDEATAGLQGGQLVTVIAPPKTGKSQILLQTAINIHEAGHNVLFQSFEMNNTEQQTRHDAMRSKVSHNRMRRGALTPAEETSYTNMLARMDGMNNTFTLTDSLHGITVSALGAKIDQLQPEVAFIDGVYLMQDEITGDSNTPQALTNITRSLKRMAQRMNIPIVISTQTLLWKMKSGKVTADSIGYSSGFFQDSDVILGLEEVPEDDEIRLLKVVASRNCGPEETTLTWRWDTGCFHDENATANCTGCSTASHFAPALPSGTFGV
jgi:replicative DNA helicase